jgi:hypothetical protein
LDVGLGQCLHAMVLVDWQASTVSEQEVVSQ